MEIEKINDNTYQIDGCFYSLSNNDDICTLLYKFDFTDENNLPNYNKYNDLLKLLNGNVKEEKVDTKSKLEELGENLKDHNYYTDDGRPISLPMQSDIKYMNKKGVNSLNYGILTYFSNFQNDYEVEGFDSYDTDRYVYENKIIKNKELIEEYSKTKINTFIRNARKISTLTNSEVITVDTVKGETVYRLIKGEKYVLIEKKILEILIRNCNSSVIKMYIFFKWRIGEKGGVVTRKEIANYIGYSVNGNRQLEQLSQDIETFLVKLGLIRKENIVLRSTDNRPYNKACYYEVVPYDEWIKFWNNKKNAIDFKDKK